MESEQIKNEDTLFDCTVEISKKRNNTKWEYLDISNYESNSAAKNLQKSYFNLLNGIVFEFEVTSSGIYFSNLKQVRRKLSKNIKKERKKLRKMVGNNDTEYTTFKKISDSFAEEFIKTKLAEDINIYYTLEVSDVQESFQYDTYVDTPFGVPIPARGEFVINGDSIEWEQVVDQKSLNSYLNSEEVNQVLPAKFNKEILKNYSLREVATYTKTPNAGLPNVIYNRITESPNVKKTERTTYKIKRPNLRK